MTSIDERDPKAEISDEIEAVPQYFGVWVNPETGATMWCPAAVGRGLDGQEERIFDYGNIMTGPIDMLLKEFQGTIAIFPVTEDLSAISLHPTVTENASPEVIKEVFSKPGESLLSKPNWE